MYDQDNFRKSNDLERELPRQVLDNDEKSRIIKGVILIFLFSSVVISSMVYYNAPNFNPNLVFEGLHDIGVKHDKHLHNNPVYRLQSRYTSKNYMQLDLKLERVGINNIIEAETVRNLRMLIKLAKNKARVQIQEVNEERNHINGFQIPKNLFDNEDIDLEKDGNIDNLAQSNIGIHIVNHPFGFYLYKKDTGERLFDTTHSKESSNPNHYLYYAKNYIQISTRLSKGHFTYGLGERFSSLRLKKGKYVFYSADNNLGAPVDRESGDNSYSSIPNYMTIDPETENTYGAYMFNSSPMEADLEDDYLTFKMTSGIIDLFVFGGPRPREIIVQMQKTFGMPFVPPYSALNWEANMITSQPKRDLLALNQTILKDYPFPIEGIWLDYSLPVDENTYKETDSVIAGLSENGFQVYPYKRSPLSTSSHLFEFAKTNLALIKNSNEQVLMGKTSYGDVGFIDYLSPNSLSVTKKSLIKEPEYGYNHTGVTLLMNEPSQTCSGECNSRNYNDIKLPFIPGRNSNSKSSNGMNNPLHEGTIPLTVEQTASNNEQYSLLDTHNLYSLQESKTYYHAMIDLGVKRPMIFSRSVFFGSQQYTGKWLGYMESSWKGLQLAITQTMNFNIMGNPNTVHEACGFSRFSPNPVEKIKEKERDPKYTQELCIRWLQFSSVNPYARFNDFELLSFINKQNLDPTFSLRAMLSVYIYGYMVKNSLEGGLLIRPMFFDFNSETNRSIFHEIDSQFMLGLNILVSPVVTFNERKKNTYFPPERFYDFYTGELVNAGGEMSRSVEAPLNRLPLFVRAGFVTPIQIPDNFRNLADMRKKPIELILALDDHLRSAGYFILDDGKSEKKETFTMDITSLQDPTTKNIEIIFRKLETENNFVLPEGEYPSISKLHLYGVSRKPLKVYYQTRINGENITKEYDREESTQYLRDKKVLYLKSLGLSLSKETNFKIVVELE